MAKKSVYSSSYSSGTVHTPQSQPIPGQESNMHRNLAGGYAFNLDPLKMFERFLILGTEGNTYYADEKQMTAFNFKNLKSLIEDGRTREAVDTIVEISTTGRAYKQDPAIASLAYIVAWKSSSTKAGDVALREYSLQALPKVVRTGTHLFQFVNFYFEYKKSKSMGRAVRRAIADWYLSKTPESMVYQMGKYQNREGWSHRDILRLSHIRPDDSKTNGTVNNSLRYAVKNDQRPADNEKLIGLFACMEEMKSARNVKEVAALIRKYSAPHEVIPTEYKSDPLVWQTMMEIGALPPMALLRNLGNMTRYGVFKDKVYKDIVVNLFDDHEKLRKARLHPLRFLIAKLTYQNGGSNYASYHTSRGSVSGDRTWTVDQTILNAIEKGFYNSFSTAEKTGLRVYAALDTSGSMQSGACAGVYGLTPALAEACLMLAQAKIEGDNNLHVVSFATRVVPMPINSRDDLNSALRKIQEKGIIGGTDCSAPVRDATARKLNVDVFTMYTDNESWSGGMHVAQALDEYRQATGINAKMITVAMTATNSSLNSPYDPNTLDVVGFDANLPEIMSSFALS